MILPALLLSLQIAGISPLLLQPNHQFIVQRPTQARISKQLSVREAIKLVKEVARQQKSGPRIYAYEGSTVAGSYPAAWPDQPGSVQTGYNTCGAPPPPELMKNCNKAMTLTLIVNSRKPRGGYSVIFASTWGKDNVYKHSWQYDVGADRKVKFVGQKGDGLPGLVQ